MIISVSRRTDIPAFYSEWFFNRLQEGYVLVRNPMNFHQVSRIRLDPEVADAFVFWTKNPSPMLDRLDELESYLYYFQFTLNPYGRDIEPGLPSKRDVLIPAFRKLSGRNGRERVIWRYDPIFFSEKYDLEFHCRCFEELAGQLGPYTEKCVISFLDVYRNINRSIQENGIIQETEKMQRELAACFVPVAEKNGFCIETCAETHDFDDLGICHGRCVDPGLLERIGGFRLDAGKDPAQRSACGCAASIDIGTYNTCRHGCVYCYANHGGDAILRNFRSHDPASPLLIGELGSGDKVYDREMKSLADRQVSLF